MEKISAQNSCHHEHQQKHKDPKQHENQPQLLGIRGSQEDTLEVFGVDRFLFFLGRFKLHINFVHANLVRIQKMILVKFVLKTLKLQRQKPIVRVIKFLE